MSRLDDYRAALLAAHDDVAEAQLERTFDEHGAGFASFVADHGLGPLWHSRTGLDDFRESRLAAEALYALQERALCGIDAAFDEAGLQYVVIKGAAYRQRLLTNPAIRACHDIDVLVRPEDRVRAAQALTDIGYAPAPLERSISRELVMRRDGADIDLHWALLREGRLRQDPTEAFLARRSRLDKIWVQSPEDMLFTLLVHSAFAKHLAGWDMGLHRVLDLLLFFRTQAFDPQAVRDMLRANGVSVAAWATLRWVELLAQAHTPESLPGVAAGLSPGAE